VTRTEATPFAYPGLRRFDRTRLRRTLGLPEHGRLGARVRPADPTWRQPSPLVVRAESEWVAKKRDGASVVAMPCVPRPEEEIAMSEGKFDEMKGRAKEAVGDLTDDDELKDEGKVDKATGSIKDKVDRASDEVKDAVNPDH
jgi:uncharacterized protein YjbJ (UPF0337 family)